MEITIKTTVIEAIKAIYKQEPALQDIQLRFTNKDFEGDFTLVVFPLLKYSKNKPDTTAKEIGVYLQNKMQGIASYNVVKGFLNLRMSSDYWIARMNKMAQHGIYTSDALNPMRYMVEFSSPNTNKPLHLGHVRNNLLGDSLSRILKEAGNEVIKVNLVNDRGIHICKSMLAYRKYGKNCTPASTGKKGDKLVGDFYVQFEKAFKDELRALVLQGLSEKEAAEQTQHMKEAREMLQLWESGNHDVIWLWKQMNSWVLQGFDETYAKLGISFDTTYFESETYKLGKSLVLEGLKKGIFFEKEDGSVWVDLQNEGLDEKVLLRSDGTSVYITQDIGTAVNRFSSYHLHRHIYVVGNEQNYHFQVLKAILKKLGFEWANSIYHMSYGMVELPDGKMKSREGNVVDADDIVDEMLETARAMSLEHGKLGDIDADAKEEILKKIAMGALKYFMLKVDPRKNMTFDPKESIDFNGNTGPFVQYTYARICSILRNSQKMNIKFKGKVSEETRTVNKEIDILRLITKYPGLVQESARNLDPGSIANFAYELSKEFNQYYHEHTILKEKDANILHFRLVLCSLTKEALERSMGLLGIEMPEKM